MAPPTRLKIAYFNYEWDPQWSTGAATHMAQLAAGLEGLGHTVRAFDRHRRPSGEKNGHGASKPSAWLWEPANYLRSLRDIAPESEILRRERPDVVLVRHALRFSALAAARRLGIPVVLEVNAPVPYEIRRYRSGVHLLPGVSDRVERAILGAADGVFVVSSALRDYFGRRGIAPERITVIPNGADPSRFHADAADASLRARFPGRVLAGFAGSFAPFHGTRFLERTICDAGTQHPCAHFVFIGDGPGAADLRAGCRELGCDDQVTFLGRLPHDAVPGILAAMDVLVAPYPPQDFFYFSPVKVFEYMACGRAVLAARLGQIAEVIRHDSNGLLYDPADPADFTRNLLALMRDPARRARLGAAARQTIVENYTWDHNARRVEQVLFGALERSAGRTASPTGRRLDTASVI